MADYPSKRCPYCQFSLMKSLEEIALLILLPPIVAEEGSNELVLMMNLHHKLTLLSDKK